MQAGMKRSATRVGARQTASGPAQRTRVRVETLRRVPAGGAASCPAEIAAAAAADDAAQPVTMCRWVKIATYWVCR
jgi:hypothetical protein